MTRTPLAWLNLTHDRVRFALFILGIVFAVVLMFMQIGFRNALLESNTLFHERLNTDLVIVNPNRVPVGLRESFSRRRLAQARAVAGVRSVHPLYLDNGLGEMRHTATDPAHRAPNRSIRVIGLDPVAHLLDIPQLDPADPAFVGDRIRVPGTALYDKYAKAGDHPGESVFGPLAPGTVTEVGRRDITLVAPFALGPDFTTEGTLIVSEETFADILRRPYTFGAPLAEVDFGLVRLEPGADIERVRSTIRAALARGEPDPEVDVLTVSEFVAREQAFWLTNTPIGFAFTFGMFMGFAVGIVICYQILSGDVADHLSEYATLKAMGYGSASLAWVVIQEALVLAVCGFAAGLVISWIAYEWLTESSGMPLRMTPTVAGMVFAVTVSMCTVSGLIALVKLLRADPADVFG